MDEAAIIMHLVLRGILTVDPPRCRSSRVVSPYLVCITVFITLLHAAGTVGVVNTLGARNARQEWEKIFNQVYIQPVLEVQLLPSSN